MTYLEDKNHDEEYVLTYWDSLNRIYDDVSELWGIKDNEISEDVQKLNELIERLLNKLKPLVMQKMVRQLEAWNKNTK